MSPFLAELIGTAILIILGNGVVANVLLSRTNHLAYHLGQAISRA